MSDHFCTCPIDACPRHPHNLESASCDACVKQNQKVSKIPACFFQVIHAEDGKLVRDFSFANFVDFYQKHQQ